MNRLTTCSTELYFQIALIKPNVVLSVGDSCENLLGFSSEDFLSGKVSLQAMIHAHDQDYADVLFSPHITQVAGTFNLRIRQANGRIRCVKSQYRKVQQSCSGDVVLELLLQDAKSLWVHTEDLPMMLNFKAIMENTSDYIYFIDRNHVFTGASESMLSLVSPHPSVKHWPDLLGKTDYDLFPEEYADLYYDLEKKVFANIPVTHEMQEYLTFNGRRGWVDNGKYPIRDTSGEIIGLLGIAREMTEYHQDQLRINQLLEDQKIILGNHLVGIATTRNRHVTWANHAFEIMLGYGKNELPGINTRQFYAHEQDYADIEGDYDRIVDKEIIRKRYEFIRKDGRHLWVDLSGSLLHQGAEEYIWVFVDVSERKQAEDALRNSEVKFRTLFESTSDAVMLLDETGFLDCNPATLKLFGCPTIEDFCRLSPALLSPQEQPCGTSSSVFAARRIAIALDQGCHDFEWVHKRLDTGAVFPAEVLLTPMSLNGRSVLQATVRDITARIGLRLELERQARFDFLTGLANRCHFIELAEQELARAQRYENPLAMLMLDIDFFKNINDSHGHKAGDLTLQKLADVCKTLLREVDVIGRLGGEEFAILLPETEGRCAFEVAERLRQALANASIRLNPSPTELRFTVSIGVAPMRNLNITIDTLMQTADAALYQAKHSGRNRVVYDSSEAQIPLLN